MRWGLEKWTYVENIYITKLSDPLSTASPQGRIVEFILEAIWILT
jgi:hypothetical protein